MKDRLYLPIEPSGISTRKFFMLASMASTPKLFFRIPTIPKVTQRSTRTLTRQNLSIRLSPPPHLTSSIPHQLKAKMSTTIPTPTPPRKLSTPADFSSFLSLYTTFLFDCDGVLWSGAHVFPQIPETLSYLRSLGKRILFVTNNSATSRGDYQLKLRALGIEAEVDEIFGSSFSTAVYLKNVLGIEPGSKVYVIGEKGVRRELEDVGFTVLGADSEEDNREMDAEAYISVQVDPEVKAVVTGLDRKLNYYKFAKAGLYLQNPDVYFVATNLDSSFPSSGRLFPGAGSLNAPLRFMSGREPISLGKPSAAMMDAIESKVGFDKATACFVGDRLDTDVRFGNESGLGGTLAVLTGVVSEKEVLEGKGGVWAKYYAEGVAEFLKAREVE